MAARTVLQCVRHSMEPPAGGKENVARIQESVTAILVTLVKIVTLSAMEATSIHATYTAHALVPYRVPPDLATAHVPVTRIAHMASSRGKHAPSVLNPTQDLIV